MKCNNCYNKSNFKGVKVVYIKYYYDLMDELFDMAINEDKEITEIICCDCGSKDIEED